jgi:type IV pilus modification protein PilV
MNKFSSRNSKGFSLIEVLIALVVVGVGILGISQLQAIFLKNSSDANQRSVAVAIAQKKIDDLRSYAQLTSDTAWAGETIAASLISYTHIADNAGGAALGSSDLLANTAIQVGNYSYNMVWDVTDYYHTADFAVPSTSAPSPAPARSDLKEVILTVSWVDEQGDTQQVTLSTVIDAYAPALTAFSENPNNTGDIGPQVQYTPLAAPDVIPVTLDIGNKKKESSKPLPDLSKKGDSTVVSFETITYTDNLSTPDSTAVRQEEFETAACLCKGGPSTTSIIKGEFEWDDEKEILVDAASTVSVSSSEYTKTVVDNSGGEDQDPNCTICCRDAADVTGTFYKACRLKRVDGVYRIYEPWKMIAFNIIPSSYFNSASTPSSNSIEGMDAATQSDNIQLYSDYVISRVRAALTTWASTPAATITPDTNFATFVSASGAVANYVNTIGASTIDHTLFDVGSANHRQMQARAVYMDVPPNDIYQGGDYTPTGASAVPLDRAPFFEVNVTQLAGWIPDIDLGANGANTGDQSFIVTDYTLNHDDMDNDGNPTDGVSTNCAQTDTPSAGRNYVTNEAFYKPGGGTTVTCLNASRGDFYPIVTATASTPPDTASRMYTSNDGIVDQKIDPSAVPVDDDIDLTVN